MKIKEVQAGVKISKNYNSYQASLTAELEAGEDSEKIGEVLMGKALEIVSNNIGGRSGESSEVEVGAAWYSKSSPGKLSVQYSKGGEFLEIEVDELEREGFKQIVGGETFIFRRIPLEERKSDKMPVFRIYRLETSNKNKK